ncbi:MAG: LysR family transcriptional regulator [Sphingobacteriales bacterium]|nr:LysR family transcriptional regulator [Sphingobacteriales bacterium]
MNIQQFEYVLAVAELKHFEQAAEKCFVSQSTLSTMISRLEGEWGIKIFDRKTKPVTITHEGKKIIAQLKILRKELHALDTLLHEIKGAVVGELRIGVIPTIAPYLLPLFLSDFAAAFPNIQMIVEEQTTEQLQQALKNRSIDVGIAAIPLVDAELRELSLYREPFLLYCCCNDVLPEQITVDDIDYTKLWLLQEGHCLRTQVEQICKLSHIHHQKNINFEFKAGSIDSLIRFTRANKGITLLPYLATLDFKAQDRRRLSRFQSPMPARLVGLLVHEHFAKSNLVQILQQIIQGKIVPILPKNYNEILIKPL